MNTRNTIRLLVMCCFLTGILLASGVHAQSPQKKKKEPVSARKILPCQCLADTKIFTFYENHTIPAGSGVSSGIYTHVEGYRYINIFVEFEQTSPDEKPVSLGVVFAFSSDGKSGARRYFNFEQNFDGTANPQMITLSGEGTWHGTPHNRSSYLGRFPIMGPYMQVFPFNHENKDRKMTIKAYLTT